MKLTPCFHNHCDELCLLTRSVCHLQILMASKEPGHSTRPEVIQSNLESLLDITLFAMFKQGDERELQCLCSPLLCTLNTSALLLFLSYDWFPLNLEMLLLFLLLSYSLSSPSLFSHNLIIFFSPAL